MTSLVGPRVKTLLWIPDPPLTSPGPLLKASQHLHMLNPMECTTLFKEQNHQYAIKHIEDDGQISYSTSIPRDDVYFNKLVDRDVSVIGTTTLISRYKKEFPIDEAAKNTADSINTRVEKWKKNGFRHPREWPEKYSRRHVNQDMFRILKEIESNVHKSVAHAFQKRLDDPEFVRAPDQEDDVQLGKVQAWFNRPSEQQTADQFVETFGLKYKEFLAVPPFYTAHDVKNDWRRFGTLFHHDVELDLNGETPLKTTDSKEWCQYRKFLKDEEAQDRRMHRTELPVSISEFNLCGKIDAVSRNSKGDRFLLDWKTSDKLFEREKDDEDYIGAEWMKAPWSHRMDTTRNQYFIQLNVYAEMFRRNYGFDIAGIEVILFNRKHSDYIRIEVPDFRDSRNFEVDWNAMITMFEERRLEVEQGRLAYQERVNRNTTVPQPSPELIEPSDEELSLRLEDLNINE